MENPYRGCELTHTRPAQICQRGCWLSLAVLGLAAVLGLLLGLLLAGRGRLDLTHTSSLLRLELPHAAAAALFCGFFLLARAQAGLWWSRCGVAPDETVILMTPPCTFTRCFNRVKQGVSSKRQSRQWLRCGRKQSRGIFGAPAPTL